MFSTYSEIGQNNIIAQDIIFGILSFILVTVGSTLIGKNSWIVTIDHFGYKSLMSYQKNCTVILFACAGVIYGYLAAFITRFTNHVRVVEPLIVLFLAYLSYLTAQMFSLSGILA